MIIIVPAVGLLLSWLVESLTEFVFGKAVEYYSSLERYRPLLAYVALVFGVGLAVYYRVDMIALTVAVVEETGVDVSGFTLQPGPVGYVLSGLAIGRGANYFNDLISRIRGERGS